MFFSLFFKINHESHDNDHNIGLIVVVVERTSRSVNINHENITNYIYNSKYKNESDNENDTFTIIISVSKWE